MEDNDNKKVKLSKSAQVQMHVSKTLISPVKNMLQNYITANGGWLSIHVTTKASLRKKHLQSEDFWHKLGSHFSILLFLWISVFSLWISVCLEEGNQLTDLQANLECILYQHLWLTRAVFFHFFFFRVLCLVTDRNLAASFPDFWKNIFYKHTKSRALLKDWSTLSPVLHVGNGKHPGYHLACSQDNSKHALEHSEALLNWRRINAQFVLLS